MSTRSDLKENILASKLEGLVHWVVANRGPVITGGGVVVVALLMGSVFFLRNRGHQDTAQTRFALAQSLVGQRNFDQSAAALQDLKPTVTDKKLGAQISYFQGLSALGLLKYDEAAKFFRESIDLSAGSPLKPLALSNLGFALSEKKDYESAAQTYNQFMTEYGEHFLAPRVQLSLGRVLASAGKIDEAKAALTHLIDLYPTSTWAENARSIMDKLKTR